MKKIIICMLCLFMAMPAFSAENCSKYGVKPGQFILMKSGTAWYVKECVQDGNKEKLRDKEVAQFCDNPSEALNGWENRAVRGNATLRVKTSAIIDGDINKTGNIALSEYWDKNTACLFCDDGYSYKNGRCEEDMAQSCTTLASAKCKRSKHLIGSGLNGCFVCDNGEKASCRAGNRIFLHTGRVAGSGSEFMNQVWECNPDKKEWTHKSPEVCKDSPDLSGDIAAKGVIREIINPDTEESHNNASSWVIDNGDICVKYSCDTSKGYIRDGNKCIQPRNWKELCEADTSGGIYDEQTGACLCYEEKGQEKDGHSCKCSQEGFVYDKNAKPDGKCVKDPKLVAAENQQQQQAQNNRNKCTSSGGSYENGKCTCSESKNLLLGNGECKCKSNDFKFENAAVGCVEKDESIRRKACESAADTGAYWDGTTCLCNAPDLVFIAGKCQEIAEATECKAASKVATWDSQNLVCLCKKAGYEWVDKTCRPSAETVAAENELKATQKVRTLVEGLKTKFASLGVSVWKDKEGNFNKARLASDSIAGVVLGTAGGLITSHVVKKNQVKSGFEDIQCVVGGQKVADWGDEFTVGIQ
ncbi:MAG: hypothetical protein IKP05_01315 [Alphaproteobacteria bacterium]|nr:hypothetical protein [Alphaproteobacteria bacterium]